MQTSCATPGLTSGCQPHVSFGSRASSCISRPAAHQLSGSAGPAGAVACSSSCANAAQPAALGRQSPQHRRQPILSELSTSSGNQARWQQFAAEGYFFSPPQPPAAVGSGLGRRRLPAAVVGLGRAGKWNGPAAQRTFRHVLCRHRQPPYLRASACAASNQLLTTHFQLQSITAGHRGERAVRVQHAMPPPCTECTNVTASNIAALACAHMEVPEMHCIGCVKSEWCSSLRHVKRCMRGMGIDPCLPRHYALNSRSITPTQEEDAD